VFVSTLPFQGPIASVRIGRIDGKLIPFPTVAQLDESDLDIIVSANEREVVMIEGFGQEILENEMLDAIKYAHGICREVIDLQKELLAKVNPSKVQFISPDDSAVIASLKARYYERFKEAKQIDGNGRGCVES
jgi:polyribonucleotide nucleotidyltransferase